MTGEDIQRAAREGRNAGVAGLILILGLLLFVGVSDCRNAAPVPSPTPTGEVSTR